MQLLTLAHVEGFHYRPRIDKELLEKYCGGLIALSGCPSAEIPRLLTDEMVEQAQKVVTMGCAIDSEACPAIFLRDVEDWGLPDPKGQHIDEVRAIRDVIGKKVEDLLHELTPRG